MHRIIYVAGKYSDNGRDNGSRQKNVDIAKEYSIKLWNMGFGAVCPHTNTAFFDDSPDLIISYDDFIKRDCEILNRCDAIYLLPNWKDSEGAKKERKYAVKYGIPIIGSLKEAKDFIVSEQKTCTVCGFVRTTYDHYKYNKKICTKCKNKLADLKELFWYLMTTDFIPVPRMD